MPGSGKSTLSASIQSAYPNFTRLSIDKWIYERYGLYGRDYKEEEYEGFQEEADRAVKNALGEVLREGRKDVVLDLSFWNKEMRSEYRELIREGGGRTVLVYLRCKDEEVLWRRIESRAKGERGADSAFKVTREVLRRYFEGFEEPVGEGEVVVDVV